MEKVVKNQVVVPVWNVEKELGYKPVTTFWQDFSIADVFGKQSVYQTFHKIFDSWKDNYKDLTELVMVLNHKIWQWYGKNDSLAQSYQDLWEATSQYAECHLKESELDYYYQVTD